MSQLDNKISAKCDGINYDKIDRMETFNQFVKKKNTFLFGITITFLTFYLLLPILAFTSVLQQKAVGNITWVWVYSLALFIMTIILCTLYVKMASKFDKAAAAVLQEYEKAGA
ncbi:uncharacterized membrane protein (DUF485 family) [Solibacillus kalamii]|uniref:Predicted membrane protein n=3 Tax=Solibacillus TaxID=648800 RepID=F2F5Q8_SOLSS|nr:MULTISPECIES: DUF485 domain-containing protein [Solibacillus]AMO85493.1 hypothetical protein SOLI23_07820 [Solibacillus silvestris]EKB43441.1 hypothetical protein B857_03757 [Solibacillus isronensis B3W22]MBM7663716.1 uncharacterized membrane protein (DUF485 family) [Solibacillus kalamii]OBW60500.1 hypothetical protein A9986_04820 [Solibacillus silvestris]OUZ39033.1 DUF485 domain-containing protein [Solibacillus kalamii]